MNKKNTGIASAVILAGAAAIAYARKKSHPPLEVAPYVDLTKYLGEWYEIARLPTPFEKGCQSTKARYALRNDGSIDVLNTCRKGSPNGRLTSVRGKATVADEKTNAKLKVQFFWPFKGNYWILEVDENYQYALVGEPSRKNLWILSRKPILDDAITKRLISQAQEKGFDTSRLIFTEQ